MSYANVADDELDYGEGEFGDGAAAAVSLGAPADDDEMAQEDEYDELYDDVCIGFLPAAVTTGDAQAAVESVQKPIRNSFALTDGVDARDMEQLQLECTLAVAAPSSGEVLAETAMVLKTEPKEEVKDHRGSATAWSRQEAASRPRSEILGNGVDAPQLGQMHSFISSSAKEQGHGYNNGVRQASEKPYSAYSVKTELAAENLIGSPVGAARAQVGVHLGTALAAGSGRVAGGISENLENHNGDDDISYAGNVGLAAGASRPSQRDLSYSTADLSSRQQMVNERIVVQQYSGGDGGGGMLFVGDLQWWTTDAELETALSEYGCVKNLKFYEERVSGKSKGYCQVEFYDHASAAACKQDMNGRKFHGRPCIVALGNAKSIQQMGHQQEKKAQAQFQAQQEQMNSRRASNNNAGGTRGGSSYQDREGGRGYGRARSGQGASKTGQGSGGRGRGNYMNKGIGGGHGGGNSNSGSGVPYGQGLSVPMGGHQSAMMMHQGMLGQGYDPTFGMMGRGGAYGGYAMPGPAFPGIVASIPGMVGMGPAALPGVAPHVNPAFFGRPNGMGLMPGSGMEGPHQGMWVDGSMSGWVEEHDRRARDAGYAEDGGSIDYSYNGDSGHDKSRTFGGWDRENGGFLDRHRRDETDGDWEREPYKERERDFFRNQRDRDRYHDNDEDWEKERAVKSRSRSRFTDEGDDPRFRYREEEYGRKRRMSDRELPNM